MFINIILRTVLDEHWKIKLLSISSEVFLSLSLQDLSHFLQTEENVEINESKSERDDALFIKSEDTLLLALLRWVEHQSKNNPLSDESQHILIEELMKYINWKEISEKLVREFSLQYPILTHSSKYLPTATSNTM